MILIGTNCGRVYNYNLNKRQIDSSFGNPDFAKRIIDLNFCNNNEKFVSVASNGEVLVQNIYDAFDLMEHQHQKVELTSSSFSKEENKLFMGKKQGDIFSFNLENSEKRFDKKRRHNKN
jgi:hypothetical protein